jgi:hypothetical protein
MRYTGKAIKSFKTSDQYDNTHECRFCEAKCIILNGKAEDFSTRVWSHMENGPPSIASRRSIGPYPLTSKLAPWVHNAILKFEPDDRILELVKPYSEKLHIACDTERISSSGLHDLGLIEMTYQ